MTLIASSAGNSGCIQLADRLVSIGLKKFDPQANKSMLILLEDAAVSMSYTGRAYIGEMPTDEWLVERIIGQPLSRWPSGRPTAISAGRMPLLCTRFFGALLRLKESIDEAFQSNLVAPGKPHERRLELAIVGWKWKWHRKDRATPILCHLTRESVRPTKEEWIPPKGWAQGRIPHKTARFMTWAPQQPNEVHEATARIFASGEKNAQMLERDLAYLMRERASECPGYIGADLMITRIQHPQLGTASIEYFPAPGLPTTEFSNIGFSPWILAKDRVHAPCAQIGVISVSVAGWEVRTGRPGRFRGITAGLLSQQRRKYP